jgi:hypothetical protein
MSSFQLKQSVDEGRSSSATKPNQDAQYENKNDNRYKIPLFIMPDKH